MLSVAGKIIDQPECLQYPVRELETGFTVVPIHWRDNPEHDEAWADEKSLQYGGRATPAWQREMEMEIVRGGQPVWPMLDREVHVWRKAYADLLTDDWALYRGIDPGTRHPTCCAWVAVHRGGGEYRSGDRYFYRQYYQTDVPAAVNAYNILQATLPEEDIVATIADPAAWQRSKTDAKCPADIYAEGGLPLVVGDNSRVGYDWLTRGFMASLARWSVWHGYKPHPRLPQSLSRGVLERLQTHPAIWFHPECADGAQSLFEQCVNLRWKNVAMNPELRDPPEEVRDKDKDGPDVVRYLCQTAGVEWRRSTRTTLKGADFVFGGQGMKTTSIPKRLR